MTAADIEKYRELIEADLEWRLEEIAFFSNQLNNFKPRYLTDKEIEKADQQKNRFRKLLVLVLYAHFEGFFRYAFETYIGALNEEKIELYKALDVLVASSLNSTFLQYDDDLKWIDKDNDKMSKINQRVKQRVALLGAISQLNQEGVIKIPVSGKFDDEKSIIYTGGNLTIEVIDKLLFRIGFDAGTFGLDDKTLRNTLNELLARRNGIAHGDGKFKEGVTEIQYNGFKTAFDKVTDLIIVGIYNALRLELYLKPMYRKSNSDMS
jgi:hypothetical protein